MAKAARLNLAEGWTAVAEGQTQPPQAAQGRADLRAAIQPDPAFGRGSPKKAVGSTRPKIHEGFNPH